ncbi:MAG TPA: GNAT family N-acetyltransferase [Streptosporangiaceae bacterium]|jgi:ribosomal protein S18 acetylase RimI-like enzyme
MFLVRDEITLTWPAEMTGEFAAQVHQLIAAVVELGGAIGWMSQPPRAETDGWLAGALAAVTAGDGALCAGWLDRQLVAMGMWRRDEAGYLRHTAELVKIMAHPRIRGQRLGRRITDALVADATRAGLETLLLGVRGNNHLAIQLYEEAGFVEWGRLPDVIEVGAERFDDVRMYRKLGSHQQLIRRGSRPHGPGHAPRRLPER